jgi:ABC-type Mn2+/Zn2+ transport system permease subunit
MTFREAMNPELLPLASSGVWHALSDPWGATILQRAFLEVALVGLLAGPLGCWIVYYGLSYSAESLAHGLFPGLVIAALAGIPLVLGGAAGLLVAALGIAIAARVPTIGRDTAVAVVITTLFGLGALLALSAASPPGIQALLFGDILGVSDSDLAFAGAASAVGLCCLWLLHRPLLVVGFDRGSARVLGISAPLVDAALLMVIALAILVTVQGLGNLLALAILVGPGASAALLATRLAPMLWLAAALAIASGLGGLYASYYLDTAAGASIAAVTVLVYVASSAFVWFSGPSRFGRRSAARGGGREPGYAQAT